MKRWLQQHAETIGLLAVVGAALLAGIGIGLIFIMIMSIWSVL